MSVKTTYRASLCDVLTAGGPPLHLLLQDEFEGTSDEEEDDMSEEEEEDEFMHDEMMAHAMAMGAPPGGFFF